MPITNSICIAINTTGSNDASGVDSMAIGGSSLASGEASIAIGDQAFASRNFGVALGAVTTVSGTGAIAIGESATASASGAIAMGSNASAALDGIGIGVAAKATGSNAIAIGLNTSSPSTNSIAIGESATASGSGAIAIGHFITAAADKTAIKNIYGTVPPAVAAISLAGSDNILGTIALTDGQLLIGSTGAKPVAASLTSTGGSVTITPGAGSINLEAAGTPVVGDFEAGENITLATVGGKVQITSSTGSGTSSIAMAVNAVASATGAIAIGYHSDSTYTNSISIGYNTQSTRTNTISIGEAASAAGSGAIALGKGSASNDLYDIAIGVNASVTNYGQNSIAIGYGAGNTATNALAIGVSASNGSDNGVVLGNAATNTGVNGIVIGKGASVNSTSGITIGSDSSVTSDNGIAIGYLAASAGGIAIGATLSAGTATKIANIYGGTPAVVGKIVTIGDDHVLAGKALTDGQILIGSTGAMPVAATLTNDGGITITNGAGTIGLAAVGSPMSWSEITGTTGNAAVNTGYICNNAAQVVMTLPSTAAVGTQMVFQGKGNGGWKVAQRANQAIHFGLVTTTTGTGGYLASTNVYDSVELVTTTADLEFAVYSSIGNITYV